jgi:pimeloyl-ACP methyl ester carboxylesterase
MPTIVLVHGSWHTGDLWEPVAKPLRHMGWTVYTPTVAGHGKGADKTVDHATCTKSIVDFMVEKDIKDAVILGHS